MLSKNFHIQPTEIDKMPMWEYEMYIMQLNEIVKEENEGQKREADKYQELFIHHMKLIHGITFQQKQQLI